MTTWLVVGLGNPGNQYMGHRHNVGFMGVDALSDKYGAGVWKSAFQSHIQQANIGGEPCFLLKPQTYMNLSGESVGAAARFYKIPFENIIVLHDELDIPALTIRIKQGGGNGGHNGLKSIDQLVGQNYWRVRLGIGHPGHKDLVTAHVLNNFTQDEQKMLAALLDRLVDDFSLMFNGQSAKLASLLTVKKDSSNGL